VKPRPVRSEQGFSLVELVISMTILGIMSAVLATTFTVMARTTNETQARFTQSRGAKFAGVYWNPDVASSDIVNPAGTRCGTAGTPLVTFRWVDDRVAQPWVVTWATTANGNSASVVRFLCAANALASPSRTTTIAPGIDALATTVTCDTGTGLAPCGTDSRPSRVLLTIETGDGRTLRVDGTRRVS
jgi:prepilin-type N-terminal cleavage/methylation domain-containing protein